MQMDELTQQNASLVEEATASSQAMSGQARALYEMMSRYRVSGETAHRAPKAHSADQNEYATPARMSA